MFKQSSIQLSVAALYMLAIGTITASTEHNQAPAKPKIATYLHQLYPLANPQSFSNKTFQALNLYWYDPKATSILFKQMSATITKNIAPTITCLSWMRPCKPGNPNNAVIRNHYKNGTKASAPQPIADNHLAEVYHNGWYQEPGLYFYQLKGSGVFLNVGHSLVALNKLDALHKLGLPENKILALAGNATINGENRSSFRLIKLWADKNHIPFKKALNSRIKAAINGTSYAFNRLANNSCVDYPLYELARSKGYDTIQLLSSPNSNNGWGFEIVELRQPLSSSLKKTWTDEQKYLYVANPFNHAKRAPCHYSTPFEILRCDNKI